MSKRIPRDFISDLIDRTDIVDFISSKIQLKKKSGDNYVACCPFHQEKTPSFSVSSSKQIYHCFGCKAGGDSLRFIMDYEHLTFVEAVESLAAYNGVDVVYEDNGIEFNPEAKSKLEKGLQCLEAAASFFSKSLFTDNGLETRNYLRNRKVKMSALKHFDLGYAPRHNELYAHLSKDFSVDTLLATGLIAEKDGRFYDWFRNRLVFPIRNLKGQVIAFGARALQDVQPKYLNSSESDWFNKRKELYHFNDALKSQRSFILVTEGYMDVLKLYQYGFDNAIAALGTAFTTEQFQMLRKRKKALYFCFDGDTAGQKAAEKALKIVFEQYDENLECQFVFLPPGEDPDSLLEKHGIDAFNQILSQCLTPSLFLHKILDVKNSHNWTVEQRAQVSHLSSEWLSLLPDNNYRSILHAELQKELEAKVSIEKQSQFVSRTNIINNVNKPAKIEWKLIALLLDNPEWVSGVNNELVPAISDQFPVFYKIYYLLCCGCEIEALEKMLAKENCLDEIAAAKKNCLLLSLAQLKTEFFDTITLHSKKYLDQRQRLEKLQTAHK